MAVKSVIEIDVQGGAFEKFAATYRKYAELNARQPLAWKQTNIQIKGAKTHFQQMVAERIRDNEQAKIAAKAQAVADAATMRQARSWRDMARSSKDFASNIGRATSSLLRWTALTSVVSGIVGLGGLFGIDRLAAGVAASRRSASGVGASIGEQQAFEVSYGRVVNPGFLGAVSEALADASKRYTLYSAGLGERDLAGKSTGEVATALISALKKKVDQTPTALLGQLLSTGLGQFIGLDEARRLKSRAPGELASYGAQYGTARERLGLSDKDARLWENFVTKLDEAGKTIETGFIRKVAPLASGLERFSESVTRTIESLFGNSKRLNEWITEAGVGLETFGKYLGSDKFQSDVKSFAEAVGDMSEKIVVALRFLRLIPTPKGEETIWGQTPTGPIGDALKAAGAPEWTYNPAGILPNLSRTMDEHSRGYNETIPLPRARPGVRSSLIDQSFDAMRTGTNSFSAASDSLRTGLQLRVRNMTDASLTLTPQAGSATPVVINQLPQ